MKHLFITVAVLIVSTAAFCQTAPTMAPEKPITITLTNAQLQKLQGVLQYSFQWLPKSDAPSRDVGALQAAIQELYPLLQEKQPADKKEVPKS